MTVLRRVGSLCRSHRQIWRKCGVASEQRYPFSNVQQSLPLFVSSSPVIHVRTVQSFSTFSSTTSDETTPATEAETPIEVLQVASSRAQQINSKPTLNPPDVIEAADAILTVTARTSLLKMAISDPTVDATHVKTLHQAFIDVASRCISLLPSSEDISLLFCTLKLTRRAHDLELPLHLPLYQSLCTALAQSELVAKLRVDDLAILDVANMAASSLHASLQCSFFSDALVALIKDGRFASTVALYKAMKNQFNVPRLDVETRERVIEAFVVPLANTEHEDKCMEDLLTLLQDECRTEMQNVDEMLQELKEADEMFQEVKRRANVVRERRAALEAHDSDDDNNEQKMRDSALLDKAIEEYFKAADAAYRKSQMCVPSKNLNMHRVLDPMAPRNPTQNKIGATDAPCIVGKVAFADIKLALNDQFRFHLAKEMEARDIEVPRKKDGDPDIVKSKKAFKEYLLNKNEEDTKHDDGKSFKPRYPELWSDLLASPEVNASDPVNDPKNREELSKWAEEVAGSLKIVPERREGLELQRVRVRIKVNAETGEVEDFDVSSSSEPTDENQDEDQELDSFAKDIVYMRDASSWLLPDVTLQLTKLNGDQNVLYTRQYEKKILQEKTRSFEDFF